jgi:hypothetical protein
MLGFWLIVPPIYFWFDYFVLWRWENIQSPPLGLTLEQFKHGQDLSRNLWLALVTLLAGLVWDKLGVG